MRHRDKKRKDGILHAFHTHTKPKWTKSSNRRMATDQDNKERSIYRRHHRRCLVRPLFEWELLQFQLLELQQTVHRNPPCKITNKYGCNNGCDKIANKYGWKNSRSALQCIAALVAEQSGLGSEVVR